MRSGTVTSGRNPDEVHDGHEAKLGTQPQQFLEQRPAPFPDHREPHSRIALQRNRGRPQQGIVRLGRPYVADRADEKVVIGDSQLRAEGPVGSCRVPIAFHAVVDHRGTLRGDAGLRQQLIAQAIRHEHDLRRAALQDAQLDASVAGRAPEIDFAMERADHRDSGPNAREARVDADPERVAVYEVHAVLADQSNEAAVQAEVHRGPAARNRDRQRRDPLGSQFVGHPPRTGNRGEIPGLVARSARGQLDEDGLRAAGTRGLADVKDRLHRRGITDGNPGLICGTPAAAGMRKRSRTRDGDRTAARTGRFLATVFSATVMLRLIHMYG